MINIKLIDPHPTEAIVIIFDENTTLEEVEICFKECTKKFPENCIIAIPDKIALESCSKDVLENYISMISEIIEKL